VPTAPEARRDRLGCAGVDVAGDDPGTPGGGHLDHELAEAAAGSGHDDSPPREVAASDLVVSHGSFRRS
jgi:hypothetical protein